MGRVEMEKQFYKHMHMTKEQAEYEARQHKLDSIVKNIKDRFSIIDKQLSMNIPKDIKPYYDNIASLNTFIIKKFLENS